VAVRYEAGSPNSYAALECRLNTRWRTGDCVVANLVVNAGREGIGGERQSLYLLKWLIGRIDAWVRIPPFLQTPKYQKSSRLALWSNVIEPHPWTALGARLKRWRKL
jgi:hypothetical protein